ncbi:MAG: DUF2127 domain-containing protein [Ignavibacteriales bacterium]
MEVNKETETNKFTHMSFSIVLLMKAINSIFEIIGGFLLIFITPDRLGKLIYLLTAKEIVEDPKDFIASALLKINSYFSFSLQHFFIFYFLSHGIIKIVMVFLLYKKKLWAYPLSITVLIAFIGYQVYKMSISFSIVLLLLTLLDIILVGLTIMEYKNMTAKDNKKF